MKPEYDPVSVLTLFASILVGQKAGAALAPYIIILVMATAGALVSLGMRDPDKKPTGLTYIFVVDCIAVGLTSLVASQVAARIDSIEAVTLFAPVAFALGAIGLEYRTVIPKLMELYRTWRRGGTPNG